MNLVEFLKNKINRKLWSHGNIIDTASYGMQTTCSSHLFIKNKTAVPSIKPRRRSTKMQIRAEIFRKHQDVWQTARFRNRMVCHYGALVMSDIGTIARTSARPFVLSVPRFSASIAACCIKLRRNLRMCIGISVEGFQLLLRDQRLYIYYGTVAPGTPGSI